MIFHCTHCDQQIEADREWAGHIKECPTCHHSFTIPLEETPLLHDLKAPVLAAAPFPPSVSRSSTGNPKVGPCAPPAPTLQKKKSASFFHALLILLLMAFSIFFSETIYFKESPQQLVQRLLGFSDTVSQPVSHFTPVPSPRATPEALSTPLPIPSPESASTPLPPPDPLVWILEHKEQWPKEVMLREAVEFPALFGGKVRGVIKRPVGTSVKVIAIEADAVTVAQRDVEGTVRLPIKATNLLELVPQGVDPGAVSTVTLVSAHSPVLIPATKASPLSASSATPNSRTGTVAVATPSPIAPIFVEDSTHPPVEWTPKTLPPGGNKSPLITEFMPIVKETRDSRSGLLHPGLGMTKAQLDTMQRHVRKGDQPWASAFENFSKLERSKTNPRIQYKPEWTEILHGPLGKAGNYITFRMAIDSDIAFHQIIMWYITGDETYRANALSIVRDYFSIQKIESHWDSQIRWGVAAYKMCFVAELLRCSEGNSPASRWTSDDQDHFSNLMKMGLILVKGTGYWMNQHGFSTMGEMGTAIFLDDKALYEETVERTTVNSTGKQGDRNGSIKWQMRLVDENFITHQKVDPPQVQLVEMMRDQGHASINVAVLSTCAQMIHNQGTKIDPVTGKPSDASDAVDVFSFLDNRLLAGTAYFMKYTLGEPVTWIPVDMGDHINGEPFKRGVVTGILYNHYKYLEKWDSKDPRFRAVAQAYETTMPEGDGGNDFLGNSTLLFTPDEGLMK